MYYYTNETEINPNKIILKNGKCECHYAPRGDKGLEGWDLNDTVKYQKIQDINTDKTIYFRIFYPFDKFYNEKQDTFEIIDKRVFNKYFKIISE